MTHSAQVKTTFGEYISDLRDKLTGMAGWSVKDDTTGGGTFGQNDNLVLTLPTGEDLQIQNQHDASAKIEVYYGPEYDASADTWAALYSNQMGGDEFDLSTDNTLTPDDTVEYWLTYVPRGFVTYARRIDGDNDYDGALGWAEISPMWDYTSASAVEARGSFLQLGSGSSGAQYWNKLFQSDGYNHDRLRAQGSLNADPNTETYEMVADNLLYSDQYEDGNGNEALIGTHNLWVQDNTPLGRLNLGDTVDNGNYKLVGGGNHVSSVPPFLMRVE